MTWSVACFCGNAYTAPPDRCDVCGSTLEGPVPGDAAARRDQAAADLQGVAPGNDDRHRYCSNTEQAR
jgi:hypothetical protein